jgi:hypothetical protein
MEEQNSFVNIITGNTISKKDKMGVIMFRFIKIILPAFLCMMIVVFSCSQEDNPTAANTDQKEMSLDVSGFTNLGKSAEYQAWIKVDGGLKSVGKFQVDDNGELSNSKFSVNSNDLDQATMSMITIESIPDPSTDPSDIHFLAGNFMENSAYLTIGHEEAIGTDFYDVSGVCILATPTTSYDSDEKCGVWFVNTSSGIEQKGLNLPIAPEHWTYEGWVVIQHRHISTGKFVDPAKSDLNNCYCGNSAVLSFPGEDFVENAPAGIHFPASLEESQIYISVEPDPDNMNEPFPIIPLLATVKKPIEPHTNIQLINQTRGNNPSAMIKR